MLCFVLASRLASEIVNTYVWDSANYAWSIVALAVMGLWLWPMLLSLARGEQNLFVRYFPVFAYLAIMAARIRVGNMYSLKCFLAELIVWSCFVFTAEVCAHSAAGAKAIRTWLLRVIKLLVLVGVGQVLVRPIQSGGMGLSDLLEARPVYGVFVHQNLFLVVVLPFFFYFLKQRSWGWCLLTAASCLGTGTRSPLFAAMCLLPIIACSAFKRPIRGRHLVLTLVIVAAAYFVLIRATLAPWDYAVETRTNLSTLQWRITYWENFLRDRSGLPLWAGHGVGAADQLTSELGEEGLLPHNDYLRSYYDMGLAGLGAALALAAFLIRRIVRAATVETDFVLVAFLLIACFRITDNFMYVTITLWVYMFIASYTSGPDPGACGEAA